MFACRDYAALVAASLQQIGRLWRKGSNGGARASLQEFLPLAAWLAHVGGPV